MYTYIVYGIKNKDKIFDDMFSIYTLCDKLNIPVPTKVTEYMVEGDLWSELGFMKEIPVPTICQTVSSENAITTILPEKIRIDLSKLTNMAYLEINLTELRELVSSRSDLAWSKPRPQEHHIQNSFKLK